MSAKTPLPCTPERLVWMRFEDFLELGDVDN
jgi:hypothetical protein